MTESEAMENIMAAVYEGEDVAEAPQEEVVEVAEEQPIMVEEAAPVVEEAAPMIEEVQTVPQDDNKELLAQLLAQQQAATEQNQQLIQQLAEQQQVQAPQEQLTEQQLAMQELKAELGIDAVEEENRALKEQLAAILDKDRQNQEAFEAMEQERLHKAQMEVEKTNFVNDFPTVKAETVIDFIKKQPAELQTSYDTPQGWRMIATLLKEQAVTTQQPDVMTTTQAATTPNQASAFERKRQGESVDNADLGAELLRIAGGS